MKIKFVCIIGLGVPLAAFAQLPPTPEKSPAAQKPDPRIFVEKRAYDLGKILEGDVIPLTWRIENRGTADLVIERTAAACGCTVVKLKDDDKTVRPGQFLDLNVEFNSTGRYGEQDKTVEIISNDPLEPSFKLALRAFVDQLYYADPNNVISLRVLRRGETAQRPLELLPAAGRGDLTVTKIDSERGSPFECTSEPYQKDDRKGARVQFRISEDAALGPITGSITVDFRVGDIQRQKMFAVRGEIVGDLTWIPKVLDATRQTILAGTSLAPVTISSSDGRPFKIIQADAGPGFNVIIEPGRKGKPDTEYLVQVALGESAAPGPLAAMLAIHTNSLDQPLIEIPVFALVAPKVEVQPSVILLRADGTDAGARRRVRLKTSDTTPLEIKEVKVSANAPVTARLDTRPGSQTIHLAYLQVELTGDRSKLPRNDRLMCSVDVLTDVPGAESIRIPVQIEVP